jgi:hypothetical protein
LRLPPPGQAPDFLNIDVSRGRNADRSDREGK